ncbi:MAG: family 78 glycoside hydrolase catalytic domain [Solobacterium sp.]|nr:family 78 glycoside hydrolase catalytic domain [Solobacterium sp.]
MRVYDLKTLHETELLGLDTKPYFSWKMESQEKDTMQTAYQIQVYQGKDLIYDSKKKESGQSAFVTYEGIPLKSCTRYDWKVTVWDNHGNVAEGNTWFETAYFYPEDWKAVWIESSAKVQKRKKGFGNQPAPTLFRKTFPLETEIISARLYITCHGIYEAYINGERVDDRSFAPEYTSYDKYLLYQVYDVTDLLRTGENAFGAVVADGWYYCPITTMDKKTAKKPHALFYQIQINTSDGKTCYICSDGKEKTSVGPVCFSDLYAGEQYDARNEKDGWNKIGYDDADWSQVKILKESKANLHVQTGTGVKAVKEIPAKKYYVSPKGEHIIDFGQNLAGHVRFKVNEPAGTVITLEHFETPDQEGNYFNNILGTGNIGNGCDQKVVYISNGKESVYEAKFSFHGFRYVKVSGMTEIHPEDFTAVAMSTANKETGTFSCSDERINRLYENTRWSQRSNMLSIPTDCPQREKAGWTGDIGIYAATSLQNEDTTGLLTRWLNSLKYDQMDSGAVPMVVPFNQTYKSLDIILKLVGGNKGDVGVAGWGDACILVPLAMYMQTGNTEVLKEHYQTMKAWCDFIIHTAAKYRGNKKISKDLDRYLWNTGFHYGEWLIPSLTKNGLSDGETMKDAIAMGKLYVPEIYGYLAMKNFSCIAELLGRQEDQKYYADMSEKMKDAFAKGVITPEGKMPADVMGSYIIPLHYGLVPEHLKKSFMEIILKKLEDNNDCLDTGFLGTPVILDTLCENGYTDKAFDLLFQDQCPSWLYEVDHGATTIWESWITSNPDGSPMAVSLNHYAFGCVDDWMFRHINGLVPLSAGYKTFRVQPVMDARITYAKRDFHSEYGLIQTEWKVNESHFEMKVTVPANTKAEIILPDNSRYEAGSGEYSFTCKL